METGNTILVFVKRASTPIRRFRGPIAEHSARELGARVPCASLQHSRVGPEQADDVFAGQLAQARIGGHGNTFVTLGAK